MSRGSIWGWMIALTASLFFVATATALETTSIVDKRSGPRTTYAPSVVELQKLKSESLSGDPNSAHLVAVYFDFYEPGNIGEQFQWTQIAAENGDGESMKALAAMLSQGGSHENCLRAAFWAKRALTVIQNVQSRQDAKFLLADISSGKRCR